MLGFALRIVCTCCADLSPSVNTSSFLQDVISIQLARKIIKVTFIR